MTVFLAPDDPTYDAIGFDQSRSEKHSEESELTKHPVEDGSKISDHLIERPASFSCEVCVSNDPPRPNWYAEGQDRIVDVDVLSHTLPGGPLFLQGQGTIFRSRVSISGFGAVRIANRVLEMQDRLTRLRVDGVLLSVLTSARQYDRMVLTKIDMMRGGLSIGVGVFSLEFEQVRIVSTKIVKAPKPKEPRGNKIVDKGAQGPADSGQGDSKEAKRSVAKKLLDLVT